VEVRQVPESTFPVYPVGGIPVVGTPEEIDITNADGLRLALVQAAGNGHKRFVVDMTRTRFCDASGVHVLAAAHRRAQEENRQLLLAVSYPPVRRTFALIGIDQMIPSFASLEQALGYAAAEGSQLPTS
jgi:stage II sporulation protein AA (anti-sigma F factor antagonist)